MTEKEKKILETFGKAIPNLTESEKERLLIFLCFKYRQD